MKRKILTFSTDKKQQIFDLTHDVKSFVAENNVKNCMITVRTLNTTTAIYINENEAGLFQDVLMQLSRLFPPNHAYHHDNLDERKAFAPNESDDRKNAHAHLQAILINTDVTLSVVNQQLMLGTYQSILFLELDGPRNNRHVELLLYAEDRA